MAEGGGGLTAEVLTLMPSFVKKFITDSKVNRKVRLTNTHIYMKTQFSSPLV
jgi:hypothetical protein